MEVIFIDWIYSNLLIFILKYSNSKFLSSVLPLIFILKSKTMYSFYNSSSLFNSVISTILFNEKSIISSLSNFIDDIFSKTNSTLQIP